MTLQAIYAAGDQPWANAPWMPFALAELGQHEVAGDEDNPRILDYYEAVVGTRGRKLHDETPWCSAFANFCIARAGLEGTQSLSARSWMKWGHELAAPFKGCVCVFWRDTPAGPHGHVAFWMGASRGNVIVLGGNQGNAVCVKPYPSRRLLCYRTF